MTADNADMVTTMNGFEKFLAVWLLIGAMNAIGWGEQVKAACKRPLQSPGYVVLTAAGPIALAFILMAPEPKCSAV